ncbi:MAG: CaiB/BaiF CoA-transferase family protein [Gammaproteobacteria bacterium]|nr:CaiB/BaiF CoA-transferase family protein [Gammaproteobacteria bacterium]MDE0444219.1 CaiB/BaiF CoA-transferase family protein [Gammaproteobacteria bacterium]
MNGPLAGYTVLDLTIARAGPTAVRLLADWGADVIKIEAPPAVGGAMTGARRGPDEQNLHRNKRSLCINLKDPEGHALFMTLAAKADVIVENFRAEVKHRLKVDYESVRMVNESIVYASISGFGQDGPYSKRPGVDQIVQGMSGLMSITGEPGRGPMRVGIAISDTAAGMFLGQGILLALLHREKTGEGQWVHTSLLEAMLNKLDFQGARYTMLGDVPGQQGNDHPIATPMGAFRCKDGHVNIAAPSDRMWKSFCDAVGADSLLADERYDSVRKRRAEKVELNAEIEKAIAHLPVEEVVGKLNAAGVPCGPIGDIQGGFENPQAKHLGMAKRAVHTELGEVNLIRSPINLSRFPHPECFDHAAPDPGADSDRVLAEFGFAPNEIEELRASGAVY